MSTGPVDHSGTREVLAVYLDGAWTTAVLVERRPYVESWRAHEFQFVVEHKGRMRTLESWEVRFPQHEEDQTARIMLRAPVVRPPRGSSSTE
jgi:hypothetical protein